MTNLIIELLIVTAYVVGLALYLKHIEKQYLRAGAFSERIMHLKAIAVYLQSQVDQEPLPPPAEILTGLISLLKDADKQEVLAKTYSHEKISDTIEQQIKQKAKEKTTHAINNNPPGTGGAPGADFNQS